MKDYIFVMLLKMFVYADSITILGRVFHYFDNPISTNINIGKLRVVRECVNQKYTYVKMGNNSITCNDRTVICK